MFRFLILLIGAISLLTTLNVRADQTTVITPATSGTTTTTVDPNTQETTTTQTNPVTQQTTITKVNPTTQETTTTIITPAPAPKEVVPLPQGSTNCFTVAAGWYQNIWVPEHTVCQYGPTSTEGVAWIAGHWTCTKFKATECTRWDWKPGRWVKSLQVY
jgi:hypothetical protein